MEEIPILGVIVGRGQVKMEQEKIKVVKEWKTPMKTKDVESFLEFMNFYRQFIQNFSHTAKLLNELKEKKEWEWKEEHQQAFDELKNKIMSQPVLSLSKREGKFRMEMDASGHAIGGVLSQEQEGKWKPIAFLSRTMQPAERNYNFTLQHIPGKTNTKADILSRKDQVNTKNDNKDVQLLKEELWTRRITVEVTILKRMTTTDNLEIMKEIKRDNTKEWEVVQALEKNDGLSWKEDGIVYVEGRIYVPNNKRIMTQWM